MEIQTIQKQVLDINGKIMNLETSIGSGGHRGGNGTGTFMGNGRPISDCKAVSSLPVYSGGAGYREFLEKLTDAVDQARPGMGDLLRNLCRCASATGENFTMEMFEEGKSHSSAGLNVSVKTATGTSTRNLGITTGWPTLDWSRVLADLYHVLIEKLSGDTLKMVVNSKGNGVRALCEVHRWCTQQSAAGLMARAERLDNPEKAKTPEDVYARVQAWVAEYEEVTGIEPELIKSDT